MTYFLLAYLEGFYLLLRLDDEGHGLGGVVAGLELVQHLVHGGVVILKNVTFLVIK